MAKNIEGRIKLNVDVVVNVDRGRMGFGWIMRDANEDFAAAKAVPWDGVYQLDAKAIGIREALSWLEEMVVDCVYIEMNAQKVYQFILYNSFI